jgi:integrase
MAAKINQRSVKELTPPEQGNRIVWDSEIKGFGVRLTASGVKSYILDYRVHGRQRRYTIGRHPEWTVEAARRKAAELKPRIADGYDPLEVKQKQTGEPTVADLSAQYLERHAIPNKRAGSLRDDQRMLDAIVLPKLGKLRLAAVGARDIEALAASLKATPYQANRVLALLSHMFNKAAEWKWTTENPVQGIPRYHEDRRERWLSGEELAAFAAALDSYGAENPSAANALRLLLLTGAREGEVLKADWMQFDLERGVWTKPSAHTKEKKIEHVPLSDQALAILRAMKFEGATGPLFPGSNGSARVTLRRPWMQVCKLAGLAREIRLKGRRREIVRYKPTLRIHDLRHNFASYLVSNGASLPIVGKLLGHTQVATTQRYAHLADAPLRDAANVFGRIFAASKPEGGDNTSNQGS